MFGRRDLLRSGAFSITRFARPKAADESRNQLADLRDFGSTGTRMEDDSAKIRAAIEQIRGSGGTILFPPGVVYAKAIDVPNNLTLRGAGIGATTVKLLPSSNTDLFRQIGYSNNVEFANMYLRLAALTLDGNKSHNDKGSLLVVRGYRSSVTDVRFFQAPGHAILYSELSVNGVAAKNGLAENRFSQCFFDESEGAAIYAANGDNNQISDLFVQSCVFNRNGRSGYYQLDLERAAGCHLFGNHMYGGAIGDVRALRAGALILALNNFDGTSNRGLAGAPVRQVYITAGGWSSAVIANNLFHTRVKNAPVQWHQLEIVSANPEGISITGNSFFSEKESVRSIVFPSRHHQGVVMTGNSYSANSPKPE